MYSVIDLETTVLSGDNYCNFDLEIVLPVVNSISIE